MADIVVVDDDRDAAEFLSLLLTRHGHHVRTAHDGEAGLQLLRERIPEVLFVDVQMPVLDGLAMLRQTAAEGLRLSRLAVILMSGGADLAGLARQADTPHVLAKPCTISAALAVLAQALATVAARQPGSHGVGEET
jgi:CheY-like chemotaxis protein